MGNKEVQRSEVKEERGGKSHREKRRNFQMLKERRGNKEITEGCFRCSEELTLPPLFWFSLPPKNFIIM